MPRQDHRGQVEAPPTVSLPIGAGRRRCCGPSTAHPLHLDDSYPRRRRWQLLDCLATGGPPQRSDRIIMTTATGSDASHDNGRPLSGRSGEANDSEADQRAQRHAPSASLADSGSFGALTCRSTRWSPSIDQLAAASTTMSGKSHDWNFEKIPS